MSMAKKSRPPLKTAAAGKEDPHKYRNPPKHSIDLSRIRTRLQKLAFNTKAQK
jgi:hypothetical protein